MSHIPRGNTFSGAPTRISGYIVQGTCFPATGFWALCLRGDYRVRLGFWACVRALGQRVSSLSTKTHPPKVIALYISFLPLPYQFQLGKRDGLNCFSCPTPARCIASSVLCCFTYVFLAWALTAASLPSQSLVTGPTCFPLEELSPCPIWPSPYDFQTEPTCPFGTADNHRSRNTKVTAVISYIIVMILSLWIRRLRKYWYYG